ncbi:MAG: hypothetical protein KF855_09070 [Acidobacteria bacterium]|nr:hypothetical protein [Acidobacteriota bacterium]
MKKFTIIFALILTAFAAGSNAQFIGGMGSTWNNPVSAQLNRAMWDRINQKSILAPSLRKMGCTQAQINKMNLSQAQIALAKKTCTPGNGTAQNAQTGGKTTSASTAKPKTPARPATPSTAGYSTTFKPTGTRIVMPQLVASITDDKTQQQNLINIIGSAMDMYEKKQRPRGFGDDVAAAMAFFASVAIHLQDTGTTINQPGADALTIALREALGDKLINVSNRDKQQTYETLLTLGMFMGVLAENADADTLATLKKESASLCEQYLKLDVTKYRFDDNGLVEISPAKNVPAPGGKATAPPSGGKIDPKLIGSWQASSAEIYVLHADGRFNHFSTQSQVEGRFTVSNGKMYFSNIVYEKGKQWEKRYPDAVYEYEVGKDGQGDYLKIANFLYGVTYVNIKTAYKFRK